MQEWRTLALLSQPGLSALDVAAVNLACAVGLPSADRYAPAAVLARLNDWTQHAARFTEENLPEFHARPERYGNSELYFRVLVLVTALQRDCGLRYNPAKIPADAPFDANDTFVSGAALGDGGTCASIPVVLAAVGRRLGYPIKLAAARCKGAGHLFARWDRPGEPSFNIEATGRGLRVHPDEYYRTGDYQVTAEQEAKLCLLKSMSPREELADFLTQRGFRWLELGKLRQAVEAFAFASGLAPHNRGYHNTLGRTLLAWRTEVEARKPGRFPALHFRPFPPPRLFPTGLAHELEQGILTLTATECLLNAPDLERQWWQPLRRGLVPERPMPAAIDVRFTATDACHLEARHASSTVGRVQGVAHA